MVTLSSPVAQQCDSLPCRGQYSLTVSPVNGFSRQEYWSGLPFPTLGDLPDPGNKPASLSSPALAGRFFTTEPLGKPMPSLRPFFINNLPM